jgi:hypothetical protein
MGDLQKIMGIAPAGIQKVSGIAVASIQKVMGLTYPSSTETEIAASTVVASPTLTGDPGSYDLALGFDLSEADYGGLMTNLACWAKIDFGADQTLTRLRFRYGPDSSGTHAQTISISTDNSTWYPICSWTGQTYYPSLSGWVYISIPVRYIKYDKAAPNAARLYYMGVVKSVYSYGANVLTGGTATASSTQGTYYASLAVDGDDGTRWNNNNSIPAWWKYDLGAGITKTVQKLRFHGAMSHVKNFTLAGSNNDSDYTTLLSALCPQQAGWNSYEFSNATAYRYYKMSMSDTFAQNWMSLYEIQMMERA